MEIIPPGIACTSTPVSTGSTFADEAGWRYIIGSRSLDLRKLTAAVNAAVRGRGGGKPQMITGRASASRLEIEAGINGLIV